jgi:3',5'-cyclic AMP phosphodiesterase CpdA
VKKEKIFCILSSLIAVVFAFFSIMSCSSSTDAAAQEWKFAYMSDHKLDQATDSINYTNLPAVQRIAGDIVAQGASMVITAGDLIDGRGQGIAGLNAQYAAWIGAMAAVYTAKIPVYAVPGNHEYWGDTKNSCVSAWNETIAPLLPVGRTNNPTHPDMEYSFAFKNAFFLGINQNQFEQGVNRPYYYHGNDIDWIESQLASRNTVIQPHVIAFGHMPQFQTGYEWADHNHKSNREDYWNTLGGAGVKMYLTGHSHLYALALVKTKDGSSSIYQILAGSGGAEKDSWSGNYAPSEAARITAIDKDTNYEGYALVTISDRQVTMEWRYYDPVAAAFKSRVGFTYGQ